MECSIVNDDPSCNHAKKRQLKGSKRVEVTKKLVGGKILPSIRRRKVAHEILEVEEDEPPILFSGHVLRKATQEREDQLLDVEFSSIMESLHALKYSARTEGSIRSLGLDPLYIHYWTNNQTALYEQYHDSICINATRSLVKKVELLNGELSSIHLYEAVTTVRNSHVPFCQMLSAAHDINAISYWLEEFLRIGSSDKATFPLPKEVVTDWDQALLGAVARTFVENITLRDYLISCFNLITKQDCAMPRALIRLDICHFMNNIANWKCWAKVHNRVRVFYIRSIAVLQQQDNFEKLQDYVRAILYVSLNSNRGPHNSSTKAREFLTAAIRGRTEEYNIPPEEEDEEIEEECEMQEDDNIVKWATNLYESCVKDIAQEPDTEDVNGFYCPDAAKKLLALLPYFPLFTEVMLPIFGYGTVRATSAPVESDFNSLKNRILKDDSLPMRVDKYVSRHISSLDGKLKLALASVQCESDNSTDEQI